MIKLVTMSEFRISLFFEVITVTHDQLRMTHPNDSPVLFIPYFFFSARFIIRARKVLKRNIARYVVIIISFLGVISYLFFILR